VPELSSPLVFPRGSPVLAYWLTHAEGMKVEPLGAVVERVLVATPFEPPEALVVRSAKGRMRTIPVQAIAAVEPDGGTLYLERGPGRAARTAARSQIAYAWLRPRAAHGARVSGRYGRFAASRTAAAIAWFVPRFAEGVGITAALVFRGGRWAAQRGAERISSASRNARSSDWRAFRRGSRSVS
jgi:hypothetical protein